MDVAGVAFEQGLCLPTPETVPFRLTRDFVDGMGVLGYEGTFRRWAFLKKSHFGFVDDLKCLVAVKKRCN